MFLKRCYLRLNNKLPKICKTYVKKNQTESLSIVNAFCFSYIFDIRLKLDLQIGGAESPNSNICVVISCELVEKLKIFRIFVIEIGFKFHALLICQTNFNHRP